MMKRKEKTKKEKGKRISNIHICFDHVFCELAKLNSGASVTIVKVYICKSFAALYCDYHEAAFTSYVETTYSIFT